MNLILLIVLVVLLLGALPAWPYSANWGYFPSGALGMVLVIVLILARGRLPLDVQDTHHQTGLILHADGFADRVRSRGSATCQVRSMKRTSTVAASEKISSGA